MTVGPSNYARRRNDLYETPAWVTQALLRHFPVRGLEVWEPAAGRHAMADVLRAAGARRVFTSDIATYDREHDRIFDFLVDPWIESGPTHFDALVTNPPYGPQNRTMVRFAEMALQRCSGLVTLLGTAKFDSGRTRLHLTRDNPRFAGKVVLVDRPQWFAGATTGTEDFSWYVWRPAAAPPAPPILIYEGKRADSAPRPV